MQDIRNGLVSLGQQIAHVIYEKYLMPPDQASLHGSLKENSSDVQVVNAQSNSSFNSNSTGFIAVTTAGGCTLFVVFVVAAACYFVKKSQAGSEEAKSLLPQQNQHIASTSDESSLDVTIVEDSEASMSVSSTPTTSMAGQACEAYGNTSSAEPVYQQKIQHNNDVEFV